MPQVWWYVSCCAYHPAGVALDFFIEYPALRSRLLAGAAPWKYNVEGFLYYQVAGWFCDKSNAHADIQKNCYNGSFRRGRCCHSVAPQYISFANILIQIY